MPPVLEGKRRGRALAGGIGLVVATGYITSATSLPWGTVVSPGAAIYPILMGAVFGIVCIMTIIEAVWSSAVSGSIEWPARGPAIKVLLTTAALIAYVILIPFLGLIAASGVFMALVMRILVPVPLAKLLAMSIVLSVGIYVVFSRVFTLPFPIGPWGF